MCNCMASLSMNSSGSWNKKSKKRGYWNDATSRLTSMGCRLCSLGWVEAPMALSDIEGMLLLSDLMMKGLHYFWETWIGALSRWNSQWKVLTRAMMLNLDFLQLSWREMWKGLVWIMFKRVVWSLRPIQMSCAAYCISQQCSVLPFAHLCNGIDNGMFMRPIKHLEHDLMCHVHMVMMKTYCHHQYCFVASEFAKHNSKDNIFLQRTSHMGHKNVLLFYFTVKESLNITHAGLELVRFLH